MCRANLHAEALAYITQLEQRLAQAERERDDLSLKNLFLETSLESVMEEYTAAKRERDVAVKDLSVRDKCLVCKQELFGDDSYIQNSCFDCTNWCNFKWRGVTEENQ